MELEMNRRREGSNLMDTTTLVLAAVAAILLVIAFRRGSDLPLAGLLAGGRTLWRNLPLLLLSFVVAGLAQVLIPKELITRWLGARAGVRGVLIGCVVGGLVPGAPYATFPLVAGLYRGGASVGAVVGYSVGAEVSPILVVAIEGLAAGAMLTMIAQTMIPEAVHLGGASITGLATLTGFVSAVAFKVLEA